MADGSNTSIKFGSEKWDNDPWFTAYGTVSEQKQQIVEAFGMNPNFAQTATLGEVIVQAATFAQGLYKAAKSPAQGGLGATPVQQQAPTQAPAPHPVDNHPTPAPQAPQQPAQPQQHGGPQAPGVTYPDGSFKGDGWTPNTDPEGKVSGCCGLPMHWRKFTSKNNKLIKGYFCPGPGFDHDKPDFH